MEIDIQAVRRAILLPITPALPKPSGHVTFPRSAELYRG
jgi:hypothetical protein